jgi:23S rRNA (guanosine2251-2'-O)-methyltransferase
LVLDKVEDPQNFGAIVRSAGAAGVSAVFVANASQAPVNATVFKTSAGVITKVPIVQVANIADTLEKLKDAGFWNYGVDMNELSEEDKEDNPYAEGSKSIWDIEFDNNTALVVGAEGSGLSRIARENCDFLVHIPMQNNVESLNVSVSAALSMYEWRRQQG